MTVALKEELDGIELAIGQRFREEDDPNDPLVVARTLAGMMQGVEDRRAFESWRYGRELYLEFQPFTRENDQNGPYLVLRAKLRSRLPHPVVMMDSQGALHRWRGPESPGRGERITVDDLPA